MLRRSVLLILLLLVSTISGWSNAINVQVLAGSGVPYAGTNAEAVILVRLSNPDGTPFSVPPEQAEKLPVDGGGVQLKNSKWKFRTLLVPPGYAATFQRVNKDDFGRPQTVSQWVEPGQLRIVQIVRLERGVYWLRIRPMAGPQGVAKTSIKWIAGEYAFRVSYIDEMNQGDALGMLVVK